jgi:hypothetical protein
MTDRTPDREIVMMLPAAPMVRSGRSRCVKSIVIMVNLAAERQRSAELQLSARFSASRGSAKKRLCFKQMSIFERRVKGNTIDLWRDLMRIPGRWLGLGLHEPSRPALGLHASRAGTILASLQAENACGRFKPEHISRMRSRQPTDVFRFKGVSSSQGPCRGARPEEGGRERCRSWRGTIVTR